MMTRTFAMLGLTLAVLALLCGCQVIGTTAHILGASVGCAVNNNPNASLKQGEWRYFNINVALWENGQTLQMSETVACEYQGSMCAGGTWFQVWYGDKEVRKTLNFSDGNSLLLTPNNICTNIHFFEEKCQQSSCNPSEHFTLRLHFNKDIQAQRQTMELDAFKGQFPWYETVNGRTLKTFGYDVLRYQVEIDNSH